MIEKDATKLNLPDDCFKTKIDSVCWKANEIRAKYPGVAAPTDTLLTTSDSGEIDTSSNLPGPSRLLPLAFELFILANYDEYKRIQEKIWSIMMAKYNNPDSPPPPPPDEFMQELMDN
ncbi:hypothetical protein TTRE_0000063201 [Trichuris trichiura]|uniref:Uncharacterized protein n=1 Tax=Trichuris trichiura TaxID=36087 RepID=A0A077YY41_TRITR|nr:hypothetical protein TTRE_0000063201 [Trichuris trichiura]